MAKIGITERGDAGLDFSWVSRLEEVDMVIVISKELNDKLIAACVAFKEKVILHLTVTGYGKTIVEPNAPSKEWSREQLDKLVEYGFPIEQVVLRLDPIIPTPKGIATAKGVLQLFKDTEIQRCRYSFLDMYYHVKARMHSIGMPLPYDTFAPPISMTSNAKVMLEEFRGRYEFEACAEKTIDKLACISWKDTNLINPSIALFGNSLQRGSCECPSNKLELLENAKRCAHGCIYCYWKD